MSINHKMMRMRLREKRKLIENEINGGKENLELKRSIRKMKKYKENEDRVVGNENLGKNIMFFSSRAGDQEPVTGSSPIALTGHKSLTFSNWRRRWPYFWIKKRCLGNIFFNFNTGLIFFLESSIFGFMFYFFVKFILFDFANRSPIF